MNRKVMEDFDIIVAGAGASGLMAAGQAAKRGARVLLVEHKSRPGRKLAITGKGRCNLTNIAEQPEFLKHFHPHGRFLRNSFSHFFADDLISFFEKMGVATVVERGGRVFPKSGQAQDVVEALLKWAIAGGVKLSTNTTVEELLTADGAIVGATISQVRQQKNRIIIDQQTRRNVSCRALILTTGGASYPATGSTGDGYRLAQSVGHEIVTPRPALVPLEVSPASVAGLDGLQLKNIAVSLWVDGKKVNDAFGEMTFTPFGLSGPVILTLSHQVVDFLLSGQQVTITLDLKPALDHKKLDDRLLRDLDKSPHKRLQELLKGLLPLQMIPYCIQQLGFLPEKKGNDITAAERKSLRMWLKEMPFNISGYRPFSEAIITAGGIKLQEIDPKTLVSRKVNRLFFAGEVLDIQADTGGYNLQAAFSTGYLAAESAVNVLSEPL